VLGSDHIQQAYSYAIHPEIRCEEFGLCNGRKFVAFSVAQEDPLIDIDFNEIEERWEELEKLLLPKYLKEPTIRDFKPDFGSALKKLGYDSNTALVMLKVKLDLFGRVNDELYTASANFNLETEEYCVSFDFNPQILPQLVAGLPDYLAEVFCQALTRAPYQASAAEAIELDLTVRLGNETSGQWEKFIPLIIEEIHESRFNPEKTNNASDDTPPYVFKLRDAFVVTNSENNI